jgi:phage terminase small subunit
MPVITERQQRFVDEYLIDLNGAQAAIRSGYSKKTAKEMAYELLTRPHIKAAIDLAQNKRSESTQIDARFVLTRLAEIVNADPAEIVDPLTGAYKPLHDWPIHWRRMLSAADIQVITQDGSQIGQVVKLKFLDKLKAYDLLGNHTDVQAFLKNIKIDDSSSLSIRLEQARKRAIKS